MPVVNLPHERLTVRKLSRVYRLRLEIASLEKRIESKRGEAACISSPIGEKVRSTSASSRPENITVAVITLEETLRSRRDRCAEELLLLESFISAIDDPLTRQVFQARFADGLSWEGVADAVGGYTTSESCRKVVYRYIKKYNESLDE